MKRAIVCVSVLSACLCSAVRAADDWNTWNKYKFKLPVIEKKLFLKGTFASRFRDDLDEFFRYHFYIGPEYKPFKWLSLSYQYGNIQSGDPGDFHTEHRLMHFATPSFRLADVGIDAFRLGPLTLSLQNRLDWRIRQYKDHVQTWRYKFTPKLAYPLIKTEKFALSPYVADSFYFDFTNGIAFNQNRIYAGVSTKLYNHLGLGAYYMRLATRSGSGGDWKGAHVIGTVVSVEL